MKIKKMAALAMSCAMVITGGALFAACGDDDNNEGDTGFVEDTRIWYAVGNSEKGTLKDNGWKPQIAAEKLTFKRDTTKTDENVFTLKMDIYAGDGFKFVYKTKSDETFASDDEVWARQVGIYNFDNVSGEGADAVIKVGEDTLFTTKDGIDANNLYCAKGQDGKYTITLKTFPEKGKDENVVFSIKKDEPISIPYDMYVYGDMNDFGWSNKLDYAMTSSNGVWTLKLNINEGEVKDNKYNGDLLRNADGTKVGKGVKGSYAAIKIVNEGDGAAAGDAKEFVLAPPEGSKILKVNDKTNGDINLLPAGKWVITFTEDGKVVSITESAYEMYLIGGFNSWKEADADYHMTEKDDGSWVATLVTDKDVEIKSFNKLGLPNDKYSAGDNVKLTVGTWAVKYDPETNTIKVEKYDYYLVGTFMDGTNQVNFSIKANVTPKFAAGTTENVLTVTYDFKDVSAQYTWMGAGNIAAVKAVWGTELNGIANDCWYGNVENNDNLMITSTGEWTISLDLTTHRISGEKKA